MKPSTGVWLRFAMHAAHMASVAALLFLVVSRVQGRNYPQGWLAASPLLAFWAPSVALWTAILAMWLVFRFALWTRSPQAPLLQRALISCIVALNYWREAVNGDDQAID